MIMQVHDELVFEVPEDARRRGRARRCRELMAGVAELAVPLRGRDRRRRELGRGALNRVPNETKVPPRKQRLAYRLCRQMNRC